VRHLVGHEPPALLLVEPELLQRRSLGRALVAGAHVAQHFPAPAQGQRRSFSAFRLDARMVARGRRLMRRTNLRCALFLSTNRGLSRALAHPLFPALFGAPQVMLFEQIGTYLPY
jgi:hypothetical protein